VALWLKPSSHHQEEEYTWLSGWKRVQQGMAKFSRAACSGVAASRANDVVIADCGVAQCLFVHRRAQRIFSREDAGQIQGNVQADQSTSFAAMTQKVQAYMRIVGKIRRSSTRPLLSAVVVADGWRSNTASMFNQSETRQRTASAAVVINRLRRQLAVVPGATLFCRPHKHRMGGRAGNANINTPCNPTIWNCYALGRASAPG